MSRILVVEDDPRIRRFIDKGLKAEGYQVEEVTDGEEALIVGTEERFDLILLDLSLPRRDGLEVCRCLRADGVRTPIFMLTARGEVEHRVEGLRAGADDYLPKPFAFEELLARVEAILRRPNSYESPTPRIMVGPLVLDLENHVAERDGEIIPLTPKELALLELLMSVPGRTLSRTRIMEKVWGLHQDSMTNVVEVCIRQLRKKIDEGRATRMIITVRGYGYKMSDDLELPSL